MAERLRLAQCLRCRGYTYLSTDGPLAWACDVSPATRDGYVSALVRRLGLYDVAKRPRGSLEARDRPLGTPAPSFGPTGAQEASDASGMRDTYFVHVEHGCGAGAKDQRPVAVAAPKASAPATPGNRRAGSPPRAALVVGGSSSSHAAPASLRPSEEVATNLLPTGGKAQGPLGRCSLCDRMIKPGQPYWSITHGHIWIDGQHEDC